MGKKIAVIACAHIGTLTQMTAIAKAQRWRFSFMANLLFNLLQAVFSLTARQLFFYCISLFIHKLMLSLPIAHFGQETTFAGSVAAVGFH